MKKRDTSDKFVRMTREEAQAGMKRVEERQQAEARAEARAKRKEAWASRIEGVKNFFGKMWGKKEAAPADMAQEAVADIAETGPEVDELQEQLQGGAEQLTDQAVAEGDVVGAEAEQAAANWEQTEGQTEMSNAERRVQLQAVLTEYQDEREAGKGIFLEYGKANRKEVLSDGITMEPISREAKRLQKDYRSNDLKIEAIKDRLDALDEEDADRRMEEAALERKMRDFKFED